MPTPPVQSPNRGKELISFPGWGNSKVNPVLWFFLLFLNALYSVIGVRLRDLRPNGACELNVNRTIGRVEYFDRVGLFWGLLSIYPIISIVIVLVQIVFHVLHLRKDNKTAERQQQEDQGDQGDPENQDDQGEEDHGEPEKQQGKQKARDVQNVVEILHIVLVNSLIIISGSLYIAADNFFFLVDPDHQTHNPSTTRGFIAGSSFLCSILVLVVTQWFEQSVYKCLETFNYGKETNDPNKNENGVLKILYFWSPLVGLIPMFDSLLISVVDEISGGENVRSGFDCSNERGIVGAIIFCIVICIVFFISIVVVVVFKIINKRHHLPKYPICKWKRYCVYFWYIVYFLVMGIVFLITGLMFIAADNNWPWICLAKNDSNICYWVLVRVGLLAVVTVFSILLLSSSLALSLWQCCKELKGKSNQKAETTNKSDHTNEDVVDGGGAAIEQTNTAALVTEMPTLNIAKEESTMDGKLTVDLVNECGTFTEAEC